MKPLRRGALLAAGLLLALGVVPSTIWPAVASAQPTAPARCHLLGRALKAPERLSGSQFLVSMAVDRDLRAAEGAAPPGEATVVVNSTYGASYYRPFDIKAGTDLEVAGYVRTGGQCVVDTLNVGTLAPGFEGYIRPPGVCPTAGEETIAVYERATRPLGCAVAPMFTAPTALQRFENGVMLHLRGIYVLEYGPAALDGVPLDGGRWSGTRDAWREPEPPLAGLTPPGPGLVEPGFGFGKAWREQYGGPEGPLGWAIEEESTSDASWQLFERGIVIVTRAGEGLILYHDGGVWEYRLR